MLNGTTASLPPCGTVAMTKCDFDTHPYSADEQRVVDWLRENAPDVGAGEDPIGFLLAAFTWSVVKRDEQIERLQAEIVRLRS